MLRNIFLLIIVFFNLLPGITDSIGNPFFLAYPVSKGIILVMVLNLPLLIRNKSRTKLLILVIIVSFF